MDILANENFPLDAVQALRDRGHNVAWVRTESPGLVDEKVLKRATEEKRIIATFDKDFGELAFRTKLPSPSGIILFRIQTSSSNYIARVVVQAIESRTDWNGHFAVVTENQIRMKPLPKI